TALLLAGWVLMSLTVTSTAALWSFTFLPGIRSFTLGSTLLARAVAPAPPAPTMGGPSAPAALPSRAILGPRTGRAALAPDCVLGPLAVSAVLVLIALVCWLVAAPLSRSTAATNPLQ